MFNLDQTFDFNFESHPTKIRKFITTPFYKDIFIQELAYHEASHFVFNCLADKLDLGFKFVKSIEINSSTSYGIESYNIPSSNPEFGENDFAKIKQFLHLLNKNKWREDCKPFKDEVQKLMEMQLTIEAIRFVKNQLIKNDGYKIEGKELNRITSIVKALINKVPFYESVSKMASQL